MSGELGRITPSVFRHAGAFELHGGLLPDGFEMVYETYGALSPQGDNALLICHALSGSHHAAGLDDEGKPGWWDALIGPGKAIDTDRFFVVSPNNLGSCFGSTGPGSANPATGAPWGADFPELSVRDWVRSQALLSEHLGIERWAGIVGGSLGGMQVMQWLIDHPQAARMGVVIAATLRLSAQNIAFNKIAADAIRRDLEGGEGGLALARMLGHVSYMSADYLHQRFGREQLRHVDAGADGSRTAEALTPEFQVNSYLDHQGQSFSKRFNPHTYLLLLNMLNRFELSPDQFDRIQADLLVVSFSTDWRFSPERSREIARALVAADKPVSYVEIECEKGHDSFLFAEPDYAGCVRAFLQAPRAGT